MGLVLGLHGTLLGCAPGFEEACPAKTIWSPGNELVQGTFFLFS